MAKQAVYGESAKDVRDIARWLADMTRPNARDADGHRIARIVSFQVLYVPGRYDCIALVDLEPETSIGDGGSNPRYMLRPTAPAAQNEE